MFQSEIQFEIVTSVDCEQVIQLYKEGGWWQESEEAKKRLPDLVRGSFCFMIALHRGKIIGMGRVISDGVSDAYIQDVIVKEDYRGYAIGTELVKRLTQVCVDKKLEWIGLIASPQTVDFYKRLGYQSLKGYTPMILEQNY